MLSGKPGLVHIDADAVEQLQAEPDAQHDPCRDREDLEEDDEDEQHIHPRLGKKQQIAPHHPRDRARGPHQRHGRERG